MNSKFGLLPGISILLVYGGLVYGTGKQIGNIGSRKDKEFNAVADTMVYDVCKKYKASKIAARYAKIKLAKTATGCVLRVDTEAQNDPYGLRCFPKTPPKELDKYPGINFSTGNKSWNLSKYKTISLNLTNLDKYGNIVRVRLDSACNGRAKSAKRAIWLGPEETRTLVINLNELDDSRKRILIPKVKGVPSWAKQAEIDLSHVNNILISLDNPQFSHSILVGNLRIEGKRTDDTPAQILPFIDEFGQYVHKDWPGKIHSEKDLKANVDKENDDLNKHPRPASWDRFGGWADGPKLKATGFFRVEKYNGKWWLVTPEGHLFFSKGTQTLDTWQASIISDDKDKLRAKWFETQPTKKFQFYIKSFPGTTWYDYSSSNLYRKYGNDYKAKFFDTTHKRLASWGVNSIGNCSNLTLCEQNRTPFFVKAVPDRNGPVLAGDKFYDVFNPRFKEKLKSGIKRWAGKYAENPWCVGFFVDNEMRWGMDENKLPLEVLQSPDSASKKVFIADLRKKYGNIGQLNRSWGSNYSSWDDMMKSTAKPDVVKAHQDLKAFYIKLAEKYFSLVKDELKKVAPKHLYFGPRFSNTGSNGTVVRVATKYCDVTSINVYTPTVHNFLHDKHLEDLDGPIILSEYHFGAADRGLFNAGVGPHAKDQAERAKMYKRYLYALLADPRFVGGHYFQYRDQPLTGDAHNESAQIGFVDVADTPYPEMIKASREIAAEMYQYRMKSKAGQ